MDSERILREIALAEITRLKARDPETLALACSQRCAREGWSRDWRHAGCYLHLEVSEFIEALRGKRGDPVDEAADILFVLLSTLQANNVSVPAVLDRLARVSASPAGEGTTAEPEGEKGGGQ